MRLYYHGILCFELRNSFASMFEGLFALYISFQITMRFTVALIAMAASVSGDECHDFCVSNLGAAHCGFGSYCKNQFACHNLFWTSGAKDSICVLGTPGCPGTIPVSCAEAGTTEVETTSTRAPRLRRTEGNPFEGMGFCAMVGRAPPALKRACGCGDGNHSHK